MQQYIFFNLIVLISILFFTSCTKVRESAGVTRKSIDEFKAYENPPLVIPPDFNLVAPNNLQEKNIDNTDKELAKEILFGLDTEEEVVDKQLSTMNEILLQTNATQSSNDIRAEIDQEFAKEKKTDDVFQISWENEIEVLDAVKESERIRNKNFQGESIADGNVPTKIEKVKIKKKKRFFFF